MKVERASRAASSSSAGRALSTHVAALRTLACATLAERRDDGWAHCGRRPAATPESGALFSVIISEDIAEHIVTLGAGKSKSPYHDMLGMLSALGQVGKSFSYVARDLRLRLARAAAAELLVGCNGTSEVLNLSNCRIGEMECRLIAIAMGRGMLPPPVSSMWLQGNAIDANGLRWLAKGLRAMPAESCRLHSISLGCNAFHTSRACRKVDRALSTLEDAAASRRVQLRLQS